MPLVNISDAARLTGKNRATIYRKIQRGELSATIDREGTKKLDTTELLRVFGELISSSHDKSRNTEKQHNDTRDNVALLQQQIQILEQQLRDKEKLVDSQQSHIDSLKMTMLLLNDNNTNKVKKIGKSWLFPWKK